MKLTQAPNINHLWAQLIVEELIRGGVDYFCISPGSRSSPLTAAVALNSKAQSCIHYDERGSAYHALGYTSATKRPAALISTSGTAVANFFPAIIEASKKKLPLIFLTADRPPELRLSGADQTIDQVKIFGSYVRFEFDMPCPTKDIKPEVVLTTVDQAIYRAKGSPSGPVHLNCMYREPLALTKTQANFSYYLKELTAWQEGEDPLTTYVSPQKALAEAKRREITAKLEKIKNGVIVVGKVGSKSAQEAIIKLSQKLNWPIFPDITSGLRLGGSYKNVIPYFDQILLSEKMKDKFMFDGVLHLGGRISSKRWYQFIEKTKPKEYLMVLDHPLRNDPLHNVTTRVECDLLQFCMAINRGLTLKKESSKIYQLHQASMKVQGIVKDSLSKTAPISEYAVASYISQSIPKDSALFLASSMPIRDVDMYAVPDRNSVSIGANRGASGIDGTISSAFGFAKGINKPLTLLIGDLAFLHDLNSLAMLQSLEKPAVIVIINNGGGGIFSFLPIAKETRVFEKYFGTPHTLTFEHAAEMFKLRYEHPTTQGEFVSVYEKALTEKASTIIEVTTNRSENHKEHQALSKSVRLALNRHFSKTHRTVKGSVAG